MSSAPSSRPRASADLLQPELLDSLGSLDIIARQVVSGFIAGLHRSPFLGGGEDFSRHRPYQQGDDLRLLDWRLFGRSDRLYVRQFTEHSNLEAFVLLDASLSMDFSEDIDQITKLRYAKQLTAVLAHLMLRGGDSVGLASCGDRTMFHVPPRRRTGHLHDLLLSLERVSVSGGAPVGMAPAIDRVGESLRRGGRVVLIGDFLEDGEGDELCRAVGRLRARNSEVILFRILTPLELGERDRSARFYDPETAAGRSSTSQIREDISANPGGDSGYQVELNAYYDQLSRRVGELGAEWIPLHTELPLGHALRSWISRREALG